MKNLNRIFKSDGKLYSLAGITYARGIPTRVPLYFLGTQLGMGVLEQIPILPFYWLLKWNLVVGIAVDHIILCTLVTAFMVSSNGKKGRSHEAELRARYRHFRSEKYFALYRPTAGPATYHYDSEVTFREVPRRENRRESDG